MSKKVPQAQGPLVDLALHTLGWKAFQDLCAQICEDVLQQAVSIYREAQDGGQDAVFHFRKNRNSLGTGTVQCKFTSDRKKRLRASSLNIEIDSIRELVAHGKADSYYFMTNMGVDAPVAAKLCKQLVALGVSHPQVFGREWISQKIRESARLRALVPRVYGLGDLSTILDERSVTQTQALLAHLLPSLNAYVPTSAHRQAVRILKQHGIVLLVGAPATGKSTLAAILALCALDDGNHRCFQADSPEQLIQHWNPNESGSFYWLDDAFGANHLRDDYVDQWLAIMAKVRAAINAGNRFVLTSRRHIWLAAKNQMATRNHPLFNSVQAIVNLGPLTSEERAQILYNHVKVGNQSQQWKSQVKPFLSQLAQQEGLIPEIARRLANRHYTRKLNLSAQDLIDFIARPVNYLQDVLLELNDSQQAALTLVFIYRSRLPVERIDKAVWQSVCEKFRVSEAQVCQQLEFLHATFVVKRQQSGVSYWSFSHVTIAEALALILKRRPDLIELYLQGANIAAILSDVVCQTVNISYSTVQSVVVPTELEPILIQRLLEVENQADLNTLLFNFLSTRANDKVLKQLFSTNVSNDSASNLTSNTCQNLNILQRKTSSRSNLQTNAKLRLYARLHRLNLLPEMLRQQASEFISDKIIKDLDSSVFNNNEMLALIPASHYFSLIAKLRNELHEGVLQRITHLVEQADFDTLPEANFLSINNFLHDMEKLMHDDKSIIARIAELHVEIDHAISEVCERVSLAADEWYGLDVVPVKITKPNTMRSWFSDVDL